MFAWLTSRQSRAKALELYGAVVTVARTPEYYSAFSVPDTIRGRFEMVSLVLFMVLEKRKLGSGGVDLARQTIEAFITDMDDCMREMGVGDLTVPKKVKRAAAAFYERAGDYRLALAETENTALTHALARFVWDGSDEADTSGEADLAQATLLASVVRAQFDRLQTANEDTLGNMPALVALLQAPVAQDTSSRHQDETGLSS